jgi:acetylornithine deacetylase/succinyl-diaminopimelate desuccinylase-like protein
MKNTTNTNIEKIKTNKILEIKEITQEDLEKIERLREYIKIKTVHPNIDYTEAIEWLKKQAKRIGLEYTVFEDTENKGNKPLILIKWEVDELNEKNSIAFNMVTMLYI